MPRPIRHEYPGAHYHAMCRGNNGQEIFLTDDGYQLFLATLTEACEQTGWLVHAYCLMSNHYHLLLETPEPNLVAGMKWFQGTYTQRFNAMFHRRGHLYQGRYKAIPIQTDPLEGGLSYFRMVSTYIHLNPFRAKLAGEGLNQKLESYPWSSFPNYVGKRRKQPAWLVKDKVLETWGIPASDPSASRIYRQKLERFMRFELDPDAGIRGEFDKQIKRGWHLGTKRFGNKLLERIKLSDVSKLEGVERKAHNEAEAERLLKIALKRLDCSEDELTDHPHNHPEKQAVAWLLNAHTTMTVTWIAKRLGMGHRSNAARAVSQMRTGTDSMTKRLRKEMSQCTG